MERDRDRDHEEEIRRTGVREARRASRLAAQSLWIEHSIIEVCLPIVENFFEELHELLISEQENLSDLEGLDHSDVLASTRAVAQEVNSLKRTAAVRIGPIVGSVLSAACAECVLSSLDEAQDTATRWVAEFAGSGEPGKGPWAEIEHHRVQVIDTMLRAHLERVDPRTKTDES